MEPENVGKRKRTGKGKTESGQARKSGSRYQGGHETSFHCFRCGSPDHRVRNCLERARGIRCYNCREVGHVAMQCSKPRVLTTSSSLSSASVEQRTTIGGVQGYEAGKSGSSMAPEEVLVVTRQNVQATPEMVTGAETGTSEVPKS